jgi:hypothetical protein
MGSATQICIVVLLVHGNHPVNQKDKAVTAGALLEYHGTRIERDQLSSLAELSQDFVVFTLQMDRGAKI